MRFVEFFDRGWVVNLADRRDRRREILAELNRAGLRLQAGRLELFKALRPPDAAGFPSIGARGCFMSHLSLLQQSVAAGARRVLVMEDDLCFAPQFGLMEEAVAERLGACEWDMVMLGYDGEIRPSSAGGDGMLTPLEPDRPLQCTHFYAVHGRCIERLVAFLNEILLRPPGHPDGGPMHVDGAFNTFRRRHRDVVTLVADPPLGFQRPSASDVAGQAWFDRTPMIRSLMGTLRRIRGAPAVRA